MINVKMTHQYGTGSACIASAQNVLGFILNSILQFHAHFSELCDIIGSPQDKCAFRECHNINCSNESMRGKSDLVLIRWPDCKSVVTFGALSLLKYFITRTGYRVANAGYPEANVSACRIKYIIGACES